MCWGELHVTRLPVALAEVTGYTVTGYSVPYRDGVVLEPRMEFESPPVILPLVTILPRPLLMAPAMALPRPPSRLSKKYLGDCVGVVSHCHLHSKS